MAELSLAWWKKNKSKLLLNDPLSKVLAEYDKCEAKRKKPGWAENFDACVVALSLVGQAIEETKKKANPKLFKETHAHLETLGKIAANQKKLLQEHQGRMKTWVGNVDKFVKACQVAWSKAKSAPTPTNLNAFSTALTAAHKILMMQDQPYPNVGEYFGNAGGTVFRYADQIKDEASKAAVLAAAIAKTPDEKSKKKLAAMLIEWDKNMKKLDQHMMEMKGHVK